MSKADREIRAVAREYGIPLDEALTIAQGMGIELGEVPPELFRTVAEVMAFVHQLDQFTPKDPRR